MHILQCMGRRGLIWRNDTCRYVQQNEQNAQADEGRSGSRRPGDGTQQSPRVSLRLPNYGPTGDHGVVRRAVCLRYTPRTHPTDEESWPLAVAVRSSGRLRCILILAFSYSTAHHYSAEYTSGRRVGQISNQVVFLSYLLLLTLQARSLVFVIVGLHLQDNRIYITVC